VYNAMAGFIFNAAIGLNEDHIDFALSSYFFQLFNQDRRNSFSPML